MCKQFEQINLANAAVDSSSEWSWNNEEDKESERMDTH
jgi:hypothetical protein